MKSFKSKVSLLISVVFLFVVTALVFQNCSRATFSQMPTDPAGPGVTGQCLSTEVLVDGKCIVKEESCSMRTADSNIIEVKRVGQCVCPAGIKSEMVGSTLVCGVKCESDQLLVNGKCEVFQCKSYQELAVNSSGVLNVPKRDVATGICYYTKVINTNVVNGQDEYRQDRVTENIISRDHDTPNATYAGNIKPKNIGSKSLQILLNDMRSLKLVGKDKTNESKLYVDNYFLIRMNADTYARAYGTRDAGFDSKDQYGNWYANSKFSDYILFNDKKVDLEHFVDGGTAYVPPIDITGKVKVGVQTDVHIHALDCGGGQHVDDVYLLLQ